MSVWVIRFEIYGFECRNNSLIKVSALFVDETHVHMGSRVMRIKLKRLESADRGLSKVAEIFIDAAQVHQASGLSGLSSRDLSMEASV